MKYDLTGKTFGRITVKAYIGKPRGWLALCSCGAIITALSGNLRNGRTQSCGCYNKERRIETKSVNLKGKKFGRLLVKQYVGKSDDHLCLWGCECDCGNTVVVRSRNLLSGNTTSCGCFSRECIESRIGGNHPNWLGGTSYEPYPSSFNKKLKKRIIERGGYKCALCWTVSRHLYVHHIDYDKTNSAENNLIQLCNSCHGKTNKDREFWKSYLKDSFLW